MIYPPDMLDILQSARVSAWSREVYRHMFGAHPPARAGGTNMVIYRQDLSTDEFEITAGEVIAADTRP